MRERENGSERSSPIRSIALLLLLALAVLLLADDIRLRRAARERDEPAGTTLTVPLDEPETPAEPEHPSLLSEQKDPSVTFIMEDKKSFPCSLSRNSSGFIMQETSKDIIPFLAL